MGIERLVNLQWKLTEFSLKCAYHSTHFRDWKVAKSHISVTIQQKLKREFSSCDVHALFLSRVIIDLEDKLSILSEVFIFSIHLTFPSICKFLIYLVFFCDLALVW